MPKIIKIRLNLLKLFTEDCSFFLLRTWCITLALIRLRYVLDVFQNMDTFVKIGLD